MRKKPNDFEALWNRLELILTEVPSTDIVFNQYRDRNDRVDLPDAPAIRMENLHRYLVEAMETATILVVGESAGPWGCRFSGVPFTGERQLLDPLFPIKGQRSSKDNPSPSTKVALPYTSKSAEIFWEIMLRYHDHFLVWDTFPLQPHNRNDVFSVRNPAGKEVSQFAGALRLIISFMKPIQIVAIGKKAFEKLNALGEASIYVRHPSRGGKAKFFAGINDIFRNE
jgi:uracil-DNA glycosylase